MIKAASLTAVGSAVPNGGLEQHGTVLREKDNLMDYSVSDHLETCDMLQYQYCIHYSFTDARFIVKSITFTYITENH